MHSPGLQVAGKISDLVYSELNLSPHVLSHKELLTERYLMTCMYIVKVAILTGMSVKILKCFLFEADKIQWVSISCDLTCSLAGESIVSLKPHSLNNNQCLINEMHFQLEKKAQFAEEDIDFSVMCKNSLFQTLLILLVCIEEIRSFLFRGREVFIIPFFSKKGEKHGWIQLILKFKKTEQLPVLPILRI